MNIFPPQTSLIPVTVALARFIESNGIASMFGHYPYWYLGVPYQYLTGPIIPLLQLSLHKVIPGLSLFDVTYLLLILSFIASAIGWGVLAKKISSQRSIGLVVGILLIILPWRYLSALALSEASATIAKNLLPFALLAFWHYYKKRSRKRAIYSVLALSVLLLINTSILSIFTVGISALIFAASFRKGKFRGLTSKAKKTVILVTLSIVVVTIWYTPGYWITVLTNPSIGGVSGIKVFLRIFDLLRASIPLVLAIGAVYFSGKIKNRFTIFSLTWVFTFLFLTVFRFIGDPDFWQDWTSWLTEIEVGLALLASNVILDLRSKILDKKVPKSYYIALASLLSTFLITNYVYGLLHRPGLISSQTPQGIRSLEKLNEIVNRGVESLPREAFGEVRVFLSGSTVFWANALYDINQVRGGVDKVATHPFWDHAAFQLREGHSPELSKAWLESLGVSYVLVHGPKSSETYHDFRNIGKWGEVGDVVWQENGDFIVEVSESSIAWVADVDATGDVKPPSGGTDLQALLRYLKNKKRNLNIHSIGPNKIELDVGPLKEGDMVILSTTFDSNWKSKEKINLEEDSLGNILITPKGSVILSKLIELKFK